MKRIAVLWLLLATLIVSCNNTPEEENNNPQNTPQDTATYRVTYTGLEGSVYYTYPYYELNPVLTDPNEYHAGDTVTILAPDHRKDNSQPEHSWGERTLPVHTGSSIG